MSEAEEMFLEMRENNKDDSGGGLSAESAAPLDVTELQRDFQLVLYPSRFRFTLIASLTEKN